MFIDYIKTGYELSTEHRQNSLRDNYNFECNCSKCVPSCKLSDSIKMQSDPNYQCFCIPGMDLSDNGIRSILKEKFRKFLNIHGRLPYSPETALALIGFEKCMRQELHSAFNFNGGTFCS